MFFTITNQYKYSTNNFKYKVLKTARLRILYYKTGAAELALDSYLIDKYNKSLKTICLSLIQAIQLKTNDNDLIITFKTKELDDLASLITYGNDKLQGSHILQIAFADAKH